MKKFAQFITEAVKPSFGHHADTVKKKMIKKSDKNKLLKIRQMLDKEKKPVRKEAVKFKAKLLKKMKKVKGNMSMADADGPKAKKAYGMDQTYAGANELKQTDYSNYIQNKSGVEDVYFDGQDLVVGDKTVVKNALYGKMTPDQLADKVKSIKEAMSPKEKAAHDKAIADFKKKGGKVKKLPPGKAQGSHGKEDPGDGVMGMLDRGDSSKFKRGKKVKSMRR